MVSEYFYAISPIPMTRRLDSVRRGTRDFLRQSLSSRSSHNLPNYRLHDFVYFIL